MDTITQQEAESFASIAVSVSNAARKLRGHRTAFGFEGKHAELAEDALATLLLLARELMLASAIDRE